jgi:hypothetical protein
MHLWGWQSVQMCSLFQCYFCSQLCGGDEAEVVAAQIAARPAHGLERTGLQLAVSGAD